MYCTLYRGTMHGGSFGHIIVDSLLQRQLPIVNFLEMNCIWTEQAWVERDTSLRPEQQASLS
jgi:hypothetical protein